MDLSGFRPLSLLWWDVWENVSVQLSGTADLCPLWGQNQVLCQPGSRSCKTEVVQTQWQSEPGSCAAFQASRFLHQIVQECEGSSEQRREDATKWSQTSANEGNSNCFTSGFTVKAPEGGDWEVYHILQATWHFENWAEICPDWEVPCSSLQEPKTTWLQTCKFLDHFMTIFQAPLKLLKKIKQNMEGMFGTGITE